MTPEQIAADVIRGRFLKKRLKEDAAELKAIEARLESAALIASHVPLEEEDREGKQAILISPDGTLPVRFESDSLVATLAADSQAVADLKFLLEYNDTFGKLFREKHIYERKEADGHKFRKKLRALVQEETFHTCLNLLKARDKDGVVKSKTIIAWENFTESAPATTPAQP